MDFEVLRGREVRRHLNDLARLRIEVFAEWPYWYAGSLEYERDYLDQFAASPSSVLVVAFDGGRVVGASSAMALVDEAEALRAPFEASGAAPDPWFYLAESVLKPAYRGQGAGHRFFDARERAGRDQGFGRFAFCAVVRDPGDPRRPADFVELDPFWRRRGYRPSDLVARLSWREHGEPDATLKVLRFWLKHDDP